MLFWIALLAVVALVTGVLSFGEFNIAAEGIAEFSFGAFVMLVALGLIIYFAKRKGRGPTI